MPMNHKREIEDPYCYTPTPWKNMVRLKRYKHVTLFLKILPNGESYRMCFLNKEIDRAVQN